MGTYDLQQIKELKTETQSHFGGAITEYLKSDTYYDQTVDIGQMPTDVEIYNPPTAPHNVNSAVNHIMSLGHNVTVPQWSDDKDDKAFATELESFGRAFLAQTNKQFQTVRADCMKDAVMYGAFILKFVYIPRIKPEGIDQKLWEKTIQASFPYFLSAISPHNVTWIDNQFVIEEYTRKAIQIKSTWPDWDMKDIKPFTDVKWWEFWSPEQKVFFAGDDMVLDEVNPYGIMPYVIGYGGFGKNSANGKPEERIVSMIRSLESTYKMEYRQKTALFAGGEFDSYDKYVMNRPLEKHERLSASPAELSVVGDDANLRSLKGKNVSESAWRNIQIVDADQQKVIPAIFSGQGQKYESGYGQAQRLMHTNVSLLTGLIAEWEAAVSKMLDGILTITANAVEEDIGILSTIPNDTGVKTLKVDSLNPSVQHFFVRLDGKTPEEKQERNRLGLDMWAAGAIPLETYHEDYADLDHHREWRRMLLEKAMNNPAIIAKISEEAMIDVGMRDLWGMIQNNEFNMPPSEGMEPGSPLHGQGTQGNQQMSMGQSPVAPLMDGTGGMNEP